ncbi:glycosyltransferase, partial [Lachnospira eligens]
MKINRRKDVIEAFIKLQCYYGDLIKLYVVGNYSNLYGLRIVKKYKDNNGVKFMGALNRKQIFDIYKEVDAVICASKEDCLPVVMTEAMMCEKVIICSDGTGTAEVIRNGVDGFIFQKGNIKELFDICKYVIENREDVKIISKNGKKVFKKIFSMDSFKNRLLEALDEASNCC